MLHRTEGVILRTTPFSEADLIVTVLTSDYGLVKTFAKSPRKTKSRFGSSLEPLTYSRISFWGKEDADLPRLTQADIMRSFQSIRDRMECFFRVMEAVELTLNLLPDRESNRNVFNLLLSFLDRVEGRLQHSGTPTLQYSNPTAPSPQSPPLKGGETKKSPLPWGERARVRGVFRDDDNGLFDSLVYKIRFLDMSGYGPRLDGCARCDKAGYDFYISHGSILCGVCAKRNIPSPLRGEGEGEGLETMLHPPLNPLPSREGKFRRQIGTVPGEILTPMRLSPGVIRLYESLRRWDISKLDRIKLSRTLLSELTTMLDTHILYTVAKPMKTRAFKTNPKF